MDWHAHVETALAHERATGHMTRQETDELQRRLERLAFTMTGAGCTDAAPKASIAFWLLHPGHHRRRSSSQASINEQAIAVTWWAPGIALEWLREQEDQIAFADPALQRFFCLRFCSTHPLDAKLLRLMQGDLFRDVWRLWAEQDPTLVERLLLLLLGSEQTKGHARAATVLRALDQPQVVERLVAALDDAHRAVSIRAAQALRLLDDPRAITLLATQLKQMSPPAQRPIIEALEAYGLPILPLFLVLLGRWGWLVVLAGSVPPGREVALQAIEALGAFGESAIPVLVKILNYPDRYGRIRQASMRALGATGSVHAVAPLMQVLSEPDGSGIEALVMLGALAVPALIEALYSTNAWLYKSAASALGQIHDARAAVPLVEQLKRHRTDISSAWFGSALVELRCPETADVLAGALFEPVAIVRLYVACALAELGDLRAVEPLLMLCQEQNEHIRRKALEALMRLGHAP